jgi:hypothetical protein
MSGVHDAIATEALSVQPLEIRKAFKPFINDLKSSSWYPDYFADRSMSKAKKRKIDPEADRFIYPDPPRSNRQKQLEELSERYTYSDAPPLKQVYLIKYYLQNAVNSLKSGDPKSAVKFCGVYSHVIADICEPIHAMSPATLDIVLPPPKKCIGLELHANVEGLKAPVKIKGYSPKLLGRNLKQAEMGAFAGLIHAHKTGAKQATLIVQELYKGNREKAIAYSSVAQSESSRHFADFIFTVYTLGCNTTETNHHSLDLCEYPYISNTVDMLYRYQPLKDVSLIPYSGGKLHPLSLKNNKGKVEAVHGLGVVPFLGPPMSKSHKRNASIEYLIVPGAYKLFSARVGLNPKFKESFSSVIFEVFGNGKKLATSKKIAPGEPAESIEAKLEKTSTLTLTMHYVNSPTSDDAKAVKTHLAWISHGVWAEPRLY